jgi:hypothetical protein
VAMLTNIGCHNRHEQTLWFANILPVRNRMNGDRMNCVSCKCALERLRKALDTFTPSGKQVSWRVADAHAMCVPS